jgi:hypothetical protein
MNFYITGIDKNGMCCKDDENCKKVDIGTKEELLARHSDLTPVDFGDGITVEGE